MTPTTNAILAETCEQFGVTLDDVIGPIRKAKFFRARQAAMYAIRTTMHQSYPAIARIFGDRDHTSVMHAVHSATERLGTDTTFQLQIVSIISAAVKENVRQAEATRGGVFKSRRSVAYIVNKKDLYPHDKAY